MYEVITLLVGIGIGAFIGYYFAKSRYSEKYWKEKVRTTEVKS